MNMNGTASEASAIIHMTTWILGLFCCWLLSSGGLPAQEAQLDIYILMGQSNMAGRGEITQEYRAREHPKVYMLNKELEWVRARHPLHFDKPKIAGVGLGLAFGIAMADADPEKKIGLVPCAVAAPASHNGSQERSTRPQERILMTMPLDAYERL